MRFRIGLICPEILGEKRDEYFKLKEKWGIEALKFEEKIIISKEKRLVEMCWSGKQEKEGKNLYSKERNKYMSERGWCKILFKKKRTKKG